MNNTILDNIGDWNPQLMRELKGRLKPRNLVLVVIISLVIQAMLVLSFVNRLPSGITDTYNPYFLAGATDSHFIDWQLWWRHILQSVTWVLPYGLIAAGSYMLIIDLGRESRRGTLNFIRLSPQSAREVLTGKLLGVPILVYLGVGLALPLHVVAAVGGKVEPAFLLSYYLLVGLLSYFCLSGALLLALLNRSQQQTDAIPIETSSAVLYLLIVIFGIMPMFMFWNLSTAWYGFEYVAGSSYPLGITWFYLPVADNPIAAHAFVIVNLCLGSAGLWRMLHRAYHNPTGAVISKAQGYIVNIYAELLLLGFILPLLSKVLGAREYTLPAVFGLLSVWYWAKFTALTAALVPKQQIWIDWSRYRHHSSAGQGYNGRRSLLQDLLWGEKSPPTLAIAANLAIVLCIWILVILFIPWLRDTVAVPIGIGLNLGLIFIYATIAQLFLLMRVKQPAVWAVGGTLTLALVPLISLLILANGSPFSGVLAGFVLGTPLLWAGIGQASGLAIGLNILGQLVTIAVLNTMLTTRLSKLGESTTKPLLQPAVS